jgi:putative transposase
VVKDLRAFGFELDPNNQTRSALASHAGAARFAFNWGLALISDRLDARRVAQVLAVRQGATTTEAAVWAAELAGPVPGRLAALRREWNLAKAQVAPWWATNSKEAYNCGLDGLARALKNFFDARWGQRAGGRLGWPKFKKRAGRRSFRVTTASFGVVDGRHVRLPRIGPIRTKEPTAKLVGRLAAGAGRVLSASVSQRAGRWFVSFICEVERPDVEARSGRPVGVDVGVKCLAVLSTGERVPNPKHLSSWQRRQARLQTELARRQGPAGGKAPSRRWQATKARLAETHAKVAQARWDGLPKLTTRLARAHAVVVVEDLNVAGMTARGARRAKRGKAGLNRAIVDVAPGELRRQLAYKTGWSGSELVVADRWYPSSKTCSTCGAVKTKLPLAERTYQCQQCGLVIDRDHNASINLAALAARTGTASGAGTSQSNPATGRGEDKSMPTGRWSSQNRQDSTAPAGQTATAAEQSTAA